jgi:hypothetical protein
MSKWVNNEVVRAFLLKWPSAPELLNADANSDWGVKRGLPQLNLGKGLNT